MPATSIFRDTTHILQGQNCNCTNERRRKAFANVTESLSDEEDGITVPGAASAACSYGGSVPHGFISKSSSSEILFERRHSVEWSHHQDPLLLHHQLVAAANSRIATQLMVQVALVDHTRALSAPGCRLLSTVHLQNVLSGMQSLEAKVSNLVPVPFCH